MASPNRVSPPEIPTPFQHVWGLAFPPSMHVNVEREYLDNFQEIFVIGDVHGCMDELKELLEKANASSDKILKIFVGDLVNKGPKNLEVLTFIRTLPSSLSVRGNHDEVVLRIHRDSLDPRNKIPSQNMWVRDLGKEDIGYLQSLPYTIRLAGLNAIIVHAGLIPGAILESMHPTDLVSMRNIVFKENSSEDGVATKKRDIGVPWAPLWPGPEHVYFGHDARRHLQKHKFATGLDTGCVAGKLLTGTFIKGPRIGTFISVQAKRDYTVKRKKQ